MKKLIILTASSLFCFAASADEVLVSSEVAKGVEVVGIDYVSTNKAVAFDFQIEIPGGEAAKVDLSRCVADLPKSHTGQCSFAKGKVIVMVYNDSNVALPEGVLKVGSVSIRGASGQARMSQFTAVDATAATVETKIRGQQAKQ